MEIESIDRVWKEGMLHALAKCQKLSMGKVDWSPEFSAVQQQMILWQIIWKMFCHWISAQIFVWTIMIIEYPMIQFLAMHYFFVHALNVQWLSKLSVAMHYW